jgi:hypothetical protein
MKCFLLSHSGEGNVAYDGDDAIMLSLYTWMIGMPKKELGIQLPGKIKP